MKPNQLERFASSCLEVSSQPGGGKRPIKLVLHEIHTDTSQYQSNGITWLEEYVAKAMPSIQNAPLAVEFLDDEKSEIWDHGQTGVVETPEGQLPVFADSEVVGSFVDAYIDEIEIAGVTKRVLIGNAYIYEHRYKALVDWLVENVPGGDVMGSVEISGLPENKNIITYEDGYKQCGRVPMDYVYSGHVILSRCVKPADEAAVVLEINNSKEEQKLDETMISKICTAVTEAVNQCNLRNAEYEGRIAELNSTVAGHEATVDELRAALTTVEAERDEHHNKLGELYADSEALRTELAQVKVAERLGQLNTALESFSDDEKALVKEEIEAFSADPMSHEINSITDKIYAEIGKRHVAAVMESNSQSADGAAPDILGEIFDTPVESDADSIF